MDPLNPASCRHVLWAGVAMAALLAGCATTPSPEKVAVEERTVATTTPGTGAGTAGTTGSSVTRTPTGTQANPLRDPRNILSKRNVYFDFDSYAVKDEYKPLI